MGIYNPLALHVCTDGVVRDKYGREFAHDSREFRKRRKDRKTPAYHAEMNR